MIKRAKRPLYYMEASMKILSIATPFILLVAGFVLFIREFGVYIDDIYPTNREEEKEWE